MLYQQDRAWLEVSLDAIEHNYRQINQRIGPNCQVMAVLKANAYGLGAVRIAKELEELHCPIFAVACIEEAMELRENSIKTPIFTLGPINPIHTELAIDNDIEVPIISLHDAEALSANAKVCGKRIKCHLKLDTGLTRFGIVVNGRMAEAVDEVLRITELEGIDMVGLLTHITAAELPDGDELNRAQLSLFLEMADILEIEGLHLKKHCSSTKAVMNYPEYNYDYVRVAALVLGLQQHINDNFNVKTSVELKTCIYQIKEVEAGTPVSYGPTYYTHRRTRIAVVPIGFADGLRRTISNRGYMLVHGKKAPIIGKICMDYSILDVTDIPEAEQGHTVTVFGYNNGIDQPVFDYAKLYPGSVGEVTTVLNPRIPRFYMRNGKVVGRA